MGKTLKTKREKIPKITEEEYARYISALKNGEAQTSPLRSQTENGCKNTGVEREQ